MKIKIADTLTEKQKERLLEIWNAEYPVALGHRSLDEFETYLKTLAQASHRLLLHEGNILGWYVDFIREGEKWFAMILDTSVQDQGYGSQLLHEAQAREASLCGWVIDHNNDKKSDGRPYRSPLRFYQKNGFEVIHKTRLELEKISAVKIQWRKTDKSEIRPNQEL